MSQHQKRTNTTDGPTYMAGRDIIINNHVGPTTHNLVQQQQPQQLQQRPSLWQRIRNVHPKTWTNIAIFIGAISLVNAVFTATSVQMAVSNICIGLAFLLPALWWYYCESRDNQAQAAYKKELRDTQHTREFLDPVYDATVLRGINDPTPPTPMRRHWLAVGIVAFVLAMIGGELATETPKTPTQIEQQQHAVR